MLFRSHSGAGLNNASSGRFKLVWNGIKIAAHHPVQGVGIGGYKHAYARQVHLRGKEPKAAASHDTPVTVAAEAGVPGLALLAWLMVSALLLVFRRGGQRPFTPRACVVLGVALAAVFVHSLFYNALFEDPMFWGLLGLGVIAVKAAEVET